MMPTNDERRRMAEILRGGYDIVSDSAGWHWLNGTLFGMSIIARNEDCIRNGLEELADLIDPDDGQFRDTTKMVDRDALLALAEVMQAHADGAASADGYPYVNAGELWSYADRIREACGVVA